MLHLTFASCSELELSEACSVVPLPFLTDLEVMHTDHSLVSLFALLPVNHGKFPKQEDSYAFEEDSSSESLSPEQHHSDESQGSACPSSEAVGSAPSSSSSPALTSPRQVKDASVSSLFSSICLHSDIVAPLAGVATAFLLLPSCGGRVYCTTVSASPVLH